MDRWVNDWVFTCTSPLQAHPLISNPLWGSGAAERLKGHLMAEVTAEVRPTHTGMSPPPPRRQQLSGRRLSNQNSVH